MKRPVAAVISAAFFLAVLSPEAALGGPYSDELAKCLVRSTSDADLHRLEVRLDGVAPRREVDRVRSDAQRGEMNKTTARLFERLLTESCKAETQAALKYEGAGGGAPSRSR